MKFYFKIFVAIFSIVAAVLGASGIIVLRTTSSQAQAEYIQRYKNLSKQTGDTLIQFDKTADRILLNALYVLREIEKERGLPSNADLMRLKEKLGVDIFYITDSLGNIIRSDWFITLNNDPQLNAFYGDKPLRSLFSYCKDYKNLITGESSVSYTHLTLPTTPYV